MTTRTCCGPLYLNFQACTSLMCKTLKPWLICNVTFYLLLPRPTGDSVGNRSPGKEEDHGFVFLYLLHVHHSALWLCWPVRFVTAGQNWNRRTIQHQDFISAAGPPWPCWYSSPELSSQEDFRPPMFTLQRWGIQLQVSVQILEPMAFIQISTGVSNGNQGFGFGNKQRNGKGGGPYHPFCCTGKCGLHLLSLNPLQGKRCGGLSAGLALKVMLESSVYLALSVYCCCCLFAAIASCALPIETTGRALQESSQREWGQEMVGRASSRGSVRIPHSSSGSQGWPQLEFWPQREEKNKNKNSQTGFLCPSPVPS